jgi:hypothetical protein
VTPGLALGPSPASYLPQVRVTNTPHATQDQFRLHWGDEGPDTATGESADIYVVPGQSALATALRPVDPNRSCVVRLTGDAHDFDNRVYLAPAVSSPIDILYLGRDAPEDPQGLHYYLRRAYQSNGRFQARVTARAGTAALDPAALRGAHLVVIAEALSAANTELLRRALDQGQKAWLVLPPTGMDETLGGLIGRVVSSEEKRTEPYAMLERLDFGHALLQPFAEPHLGDFTRVHIWSYCRLDPERLADTRVLAWFDTRDPAWLEAQVGRGALLIWTPSWRPEHSDLAFSSKFVPLLHSILEYGGALATRTAQVRVGDAVPVSHRPAAADRTVRITRPDQTIAVLDSGQTTYTQTDLPGLYRVESDSASRSFAVNLSPRESRTQPLHDSDLEAIGVNMTASARDTAAKREAVPRAHRAQMEASQRIGQKLLAAAMLVLLVEIGMGAWLARRPSDRQGGQA